MFISIITNFSSNEIFKLLKLRDNRSAVSEVFKCLKEIESNFPKVISAIVDARKNQKKLKKKKQVKRLQ